MSVSLPTNDQFFNDIFYNRKCGLGSQEDHDNFYSWCGGDKGAQNLTTVCEVAGSELMRCQITISFYPAETRIVPYPEISAETTPSGIENSLYCPNEVQPDKSLSWPPAKRPFLEGNFQLYSKSCYQEIHGFIATIPWWMFLLIVLVCIAAVSVAAYLFWKYYLRKKIYPTKSSLDARFTSAPISTTSSMKSNSGRHIHHSRAAGGGTSARRLSGSGSGSSRRGTRPGPGSGRKEQPSVAEVSKTSRRSSLSAGNNQYITQQSAP